MPNDWPKARFFKIRGFPNQEKVPGAGDREPGCRQLAAAAGNRGRGPSHPIAIISTTTHALSRLYPTMSTLTSATSFVTGSRRMTSLITGSRRVTSGARATTATRRGPVRVEAMGFGDRKKKVDELRKLA